MGKLFQWLRKKTQRQTKTVQVENKATPEKPNVTWVHIWSEDQARMAVEQSRFGRLPNELIVNIFKHLNVRDLGSVSSVCRLFKMNADQDEIWKTKIKASVELNSKPCKQIYMDLAYEKREQVEFRKRKIQRLLKQLDDDEDLMGLHSRGVIQH